MLAGTTEAASFPETLFKHKAYGHRPDSLLFPCNRAARERKNGCKSKQDKRLNSKFP
jgi:hypothetical protein